MIVWLSLIDKMLILSAMNLLIISRQVRMMRAVVEEQRGTQPDAQKNFIESFWRESERHTKD